MLGAAGLTRGADHRAVRAHAVVAPVGGGGGSESARAPNESSAVVLGETGGELVHHLDVVGGCPRGLGV